MSKFNLKDDQLVAGLCHASFLVPLLGAIMPFTVWLSQRERSPLLRFQALQALAYHLIAIAVYFLYYVLQMIIGFSSFPLMLLAPESEQSLNIIVVLFLLIIIILSFVQLFVFCIGGPLYIILGIVGAWRVLQGHDFRYPLLGGLIEKLLNRKPDEGVQKQEEARSAV